VSSRVRLTKPPARYAAMLSHEPKNYALLRHDGTLLLRGVAFRSSRAEPFGERFLRHAITRLLRDDVAGVRDAYLETLGALRSRLLPTYDVSQRVRLTKSPAEYAASRAARRELPYEAMLSSGRAHWSVGERVRVYRTPGGGGGVVPEHDEGAPGADPLDYDVEHYARVLRDTYAARLARGLAPGDFDALFVDPEQLSLFAMPAGEMRTVLSAVVRAGQETTYVES
jgi:hypothetical protein